jgi:hypothetical protein
VLVSIVPLIALVAHQVVTYAAAPKAAVYEDRHSAVCII